MPPMKSLGQPVARSVTPMNRRIKLGSFLATHYSLLTNNGQRGTINGLAVYCAPKAATVIVQKDSKKPGEQEVFNALAKNKALAKTKRVPASDSYELRVYAPQGDNGKTTYKIHVGEEDIPVLLPQRVPKQVEYLDGMTIGDLSSLVVGGQPTAEATAMLEKQGKDRSSAATLRNLINNPANGLDVAERAALGAALAAVEKYVVPMSKKIKEGSFLANQYDLQTNDNQRLTINGVANYCAPKAGIVTVRRGSENP